jgi:hypothetical protein
MKFSHKPKLIQGANPCLHIQILGCCTFIVQRENTPLMQGIGAGAYKVGGLMAEKIKRRLIDWIKWQRMKLRYNW